MQNALEAKHSDMKKQEARVEEAEHDLQKVKEKEEYYESQNASLEAKVQLLQHNLNEAHQERMLMGE